MNSKPASLRSLVLLALWCAVAAAVFGFGSEVFAFRFSYAGEAERAQLILFARLAVYVAFGLLLVYKGGWRGVLLAVAMTALATAAEWALFPFAHDWAAISSPRTFRATRAPARPTYGAWAAEDIVGVGVASALAQVLRLMAHVDPKAAPDEED